MSDQELLAAIMRDAKHLASPSGNNRLIPNRLAHNVLEWLRRQSITCHGFFLAHDNSDPPQLWVWRGQPGDEAAEPLVRVQK